MTNNTEPYLAERTKGIGRLLAKRMPHLEFVFWDLSEFLPVFHNVRRNMIFIECEKIARNEAISALAGEPKLRDYLVYSGERKPEIVNEEWASAKSTKGIRDAIVVMSRRDFGETVVFEGNARVPTLERRLMDLLYYSLKGYLPMALDEAVNALAWFLNNRGVSITRMQRYSTRRYIGWFFSIVLCRLVEKKMINPNIVEPRYLENGRRNRNAVLRVDEL